MRFVIQPGQNVGTNIEHRFMRVAYASASVEISGNFSPFTIRNKQSVDLQEPRSITLVNRNAEAVTVEIETAPFEVKEMDAVEIAEGSLVGLVPGTRIDVGQVQMAADAELSIKAGSSVSVDNFPANFEVTNQPTEIAVNNHPSSIQVSNLPTVQDIKPVPLLGIKTTKYTVTGAEVIIAPEDSGRYALHVKNVGANPLLIGQAGNMAVNGWPLAAGEEKEIKVATGAELSAVSQGADAEIVVFEEFMTGTEVSVPINTLQTQAGDYLTTQSGEFIEA